MKPILVTNRDGWDCNTVVDLLVQAHDGEELAMYISGDEVAFIIYPMFTAPDESAYGKLIETWNA